MNEYCNICGKRWTCGYTHQCPPAWFVMSPDLGHTELDAERVFAADPTRAAEEWVTEKCEAFGRALGAGQALRVKVFKWGESRCQWLVVQRRLEHSYQACPAPAPSTTAPEPPRKPYLRIVR